MNAKQTGLHGPCTDPHDITVVLVTHNRPQLLSRALSALEHQTRKPTQVVVVDNASGPQTQAVLEAATLAMHVVRSESNLGGAGGFALGMQRAMELGSEWIWLMDDDAIAEPTALEKLVAPVSALTGQVGVLCSCVMEFGAIALQHRRSFNPLLGFERSIASTAYARRAVQVDTASFVGFMVSAEAVRAAGLPNTEFFLAYDDTEYSLRLRRSGFDIWLAPASVIIHERTASARMRSSSFGAKHYFNIRNRIVVKRMYSQAAFIGAMLGALFGFMLWVRAPGSRSSWHILARAIADGFSSRLGPFPERMNLHSDK
jgi:rhamnopyranosyl-N-acetylglucosaminyl-diphospho-decaprenol beta-1,3/1,4-galactofuranosyltransferase